ncbi:MAG TPA: T9SS type A sorting domain-containing protein [Bacteroidia bacterium]|nr:T9SS type A sorting domain-containing protein [Bacteroidia bacterium]
MKNILLIAGVSFLLTENIFSQSQGPNSPATASYSALGCLACPGSEWNNYNNIQIADGQNAEVELRDFPFCFQTACFYSRYLIAKNFGFAIPAGASVDGVLAAVSCRNAFGGINDTIVQLLSANQPAGNNNSPGNLPWSPLTSVIFYGDTNDLWGLPLTPDSVNDTDFGIAVMVRNSSASPDTAFVDHVQMTVYYSLPTGTFSQTRIIGISTVHYSQDENALLLSKDALHDINLVSVTDITGKEICFFVPAAGQQKLFLPVLTNGVYFAIVKTYEKTIVQKFAVTN